MNIKAELTQPLAKLERQDKEYELCKSRAIHHYDGARAGDVTALLMYHGARGSMQGIERRALIHLNKSIFVQQKGIGVNFR